MDLLGSILNSMDKHKPPAVSDKQKELIKKQKQDWEKRQQSDKEKIKKFRLKLEQKISDFVKDETQTHIEFEPMDKIFRSIIHDICEVAGLPTHSEGLEDIRHVVVHKKEHLPDVPKENTDRDESPPRSESPSPAPTSNYQDKYAHFIAPEEALQARSTRANRSYGIVPSENKRDIRSIEQAMTDIRERKRKKTEEINRVAQNDDTDTNEDGVSNIIIPSSDI